MEVGVRTTICFRGALSKCFVSNSPFALALAIPFGGPAVDSTIRESSLD
jgi:hypothetical protein